ncbi:uncharacterized protein METZ01_LOCUS121773, partial [marine metagenome]
VEAALELLPTLHCSPAITVRMLGTQGDTLGG